MLDLDIWTENQARNTWQLSVNSCEGGWKRQKRNSIVNKKLESAQTIKDLASDFYKAVARIESRKASGTEESVQEVLGEDKRVLGLLHQAIQQYWDL